jgi:hypothetical protein
MRGGIEELRRAVGSIVRLVAVEVLFYGVELTGEVVDVKIVFSDGCEYFMGCAGNGSVFVAISKRHAVGPPPGFVAITRTLPALAGCLDHVVAEGNVLQLTIANRVLELKNDDDELVVMVDGEPPAKDVLER